MHTLHHHDFTGSLFSLLDTLTRFEEAGIDPAFDSDMEELERQFAERRITSANE